jgi:HEAT repeat protein
MPEIYRRIRAASLLENVGTSARAAAPDLIKVYRAEYAKDCKTPVGKAVITVIQSSAGARTTSGMLREWLIRALAAVGGEDPEIVPILLMAMNEPDFLVRNQAEMVLRDINLVPAVKKSVPGLIDELDGPQDRMRYSAAALLGLAITERHDAILPLVRALSDEDETVGFAAGNSLRNAGRDALMPVLRDALHSQSDRLRWNAAVFLNEWGPDEAKRTVLVLIQALLRHSSSRFRAKAAILLGQLGPEAKESIPALTQALQDQDATVREAAIEALKKIQATESEQ